jgi:energy-converting hydrogenase A subunit D
MIPLDFLNITWISIILMIIGALGIIWLIKPIDKLIMFAVMEAGFLLAVVSFKYLDVALVISLFGPISTVTFLLSIIKINDIRKRNRKNQEGELFD